MKEILRRAALALRAWAAHLHPGDAARAAAGGYAAALALWALRHREALADFLLQNALPLASRRGLLLLLLIGSAAGAIAWLAAGGPAQRRGDAAGRAPALLARGLFALILLPFGPILAIPGLETQYPFLGLGLIAAMAGLAFWVVRDIGLVVADAARTGGRPARLSPRAGLIAAGLLALAYSVLLSAISVLRHNSFMTHAFDLGIHDQALYNILHSGYMRTTLYGPYAIDYLGDHFSPILFLLAPVYALFQDARTLLVVQSVFLAAGAVPVYLLAHEKTRSVLLGLALALGYLLYPALHGVNLRDFHQIALICAPLLVAFYLLERGRTAPFLIALGLALMVKEEAALTVAAIGAYIFLGKRRYRLGAGVMAAGLAYFAFAVGWAMPHLGGRPQIDTRFGGYIAAGAEGAAGVAWTLLTNPLFTVLWILGNPQKLAFLLQIFLPVCFLPVLAPAGAWIPALPALAILLLTSAHTQYDITYHYAAHLIPSVFYLAALGLGRVAGPATDESHHMPGTREDVRHIRGRFFKIALTAGLLVAALAMNFLYGPLINKNGVRLAMPDRHDAVVASFVAQIPREAAVSAMSDIVTHLTARRTAYLFPDVADAEYLLLDGDPRANFWPHEGLKARERALRDMIPHLRSGEFGLIRMEDSVLLLKRGADPSRNGEALRGLLTARYEAEDLATDLPDTVVADPQASGGRARVATAASRHVEGRTALVYGPYTDLLPGRYRVEYALKTDRVGLNERVAAVDVFTHRDGGLPRAAREILGREFAAADRYQVFALEFETDRPLEDVEFRVQYAGQGMLGLDYVRVTPVELWE